MNSLKLSTLIILTTIATLSYAQKNKYDSGYQKVIDATNTQALTRIAQRTGRDYQFLMELAAIKGWKKEYRDGNGDITAVLDSYDLIGNVYIPQYKGIMNNGGVGIGGIPNGGSRVSNNLDLYAGGSLGLNLSGSGLEIALWDVGEVAPNHQEFIGRLSYSDTLPIHFHPTHVAGTLAASGVDSNARGAAYDAEILAFDVEDDLTEIAVEAAGGLLVSNHSYGPFAGWAWEVQGLGSGWHWMGGVEYIEDFRFGYYSSTHQTLDDITFNAPYYTSVWASGNSHNFSPYYFGFPVNTPYQIFDLVSGLFVPGGNIGPVPVRDPQTGNVGYSSTMAKNTISVANVDYEDMSSIVKNTSSSPGGENEWRIKPDIATKGTQVYSSTAPGGAAAYEELDGTSMASPLAAGSFLLWQEHYFNLNASFMRSATVKAVAVTGADDAGTPGPDYHFGWGLLNSNSSVELITNNGSSSLIIEDSLTNGTVNNLAIESDGIEPIKLTIAWTDVPGVPHPFVFIGDVANIIDDPTLKLVNDLDIRLTHSGGAIFEPFVMDTSDPANPFATTGDNIIDNVEQIVIAAPPAGSYNLSVSHKGALVSSPQQYSIVASGIGANLNYCGSTGVQTGAYISHVSLYNLIPNNNTGDDGGYGDYTAQVANLTPGTIYPLRLRAFYNGPVETVYWRVWIDFNADGNFDAAEIIGSPTSNNTNRLRFNFQVPLGAVSNSNVRMRISASLTDYANACGPFASGEVEDYSIHIN